MSTHGEGDIWAPDTAAVHGPNAVIYPHTRNHTLKPFAGPSFGAAGDPAPARPAPRLLTQLRFVETIPTISASHPIHNFLHQRLPIVAVGHDDHVRALPKRQFLLV